MHFFSTIIHSRGLKFLHSPTLTLLNLRHSSFSIPSVVSSRSELILQPFRYFTSATGTSPTLPGERPCSILLVCLILKLFRRFTYVTAYFPSLPSLHLGQSSFYNSFVASPTSQELHLRHLASRPSSILLAFIEINSTQYCS